MRLSVRSPVLVLLAPPGEYDYTTLLRRKCIDSEAEGQDRNVRWPRGTDRVLV